MSDNSNDTKDKSGFFKVNTYTGNGSANDNWTFHNDDTLKMIRPNTSVGQLQNDGSLSINSDAVIKIGDFQMTGEELEVCLKHLMELTRENKPEEFL